MDKKQYIGHVHNDAYHDNSLVLRALPSEEEFVKYMVQDNNDNGQRSISKLASNLEEKISAKRFVELQDKVQDVLDVNGENKMLQKEIQCQSDLAKERVLSKSISTQTELPIVGNQKHQVDGSHISVCVAEGRINRGVIITSVIAGLISLILSFVLATAYSIYQVFRVSNVSQEEYDNAINTNEEIRGYDVSSTFEKIWYYPSILLVIIPVLMVILCFAFKSAFNIYHDNYVRHRYGHESNTRATPEFIFSKAKSN